FTAIVWLHTEPFSAGCRDEDRQAMFLFRAKAIKFHPSRVLFGAFFNPFFPVPATARTEGVTRMLRNTLLIISILCVAFLIGCSQGTPETPTSTATPKPAASPAATTASTTTASTAEKIGVPECDDYIAKYEACVSGKVPEAARAQYQTMLKQWRETWKKAAENPQTKGTLAATCKQMRTQQEAALKSFACAW